MQRFQTFIDDPTVRSLLPASARLPLRVEKASSLDETFIQPGCPPFPAYFDHERSWGSYSSSRAAARGQMESLPLHSRLPYLEFEIAGDLGPNSLLEVTSGRWTDTVHWLPRLPADEGSAWWRAYSAVAAPSAQIVARDNSLREWFAFREPAELGRLSLYSEKVIARGKSIFLLGLLFGLAALAVLACDHGTFLLAGIATRLPQLHRDNLPGSKK
jgi:hypothetical protein